MNGDTTHITSLEQTIRLALEAVKDPEIPVISVIDLGIISAISVNKDKAIVAMTPTFTACPAIHMMKEEIKKCVEGVAGIKEAEVHIDFSIPWDTNRITEKGKQLLKDFGLAPPPRHDGNIDLPMLINVKCPYCNSNNTSLRSPFGATLCRSMHYCNDCLQAFEQFKPV